MRWEIGVLQCWNEFFLYRFALYEPKKRLYRELKSFSLAESFTNFTQSHFYAQKRLLHVPFFAVCKKFPFLQTKSFSFAQTFFIAIQSNSFLPSISLRNTLNLLSAKISYFHKPKAFYSHKLFFNYHPKQLFFALRHPFAPPLTYCLQRMQLFFCCSL